MSAWATGYVYNHADPTITGSAFTVLLALADYAHDDGSNAFPSVKTLARKSRVSERTAQYALRTLVERGAIEESGETSSGTRVWRILGVQDLHRGGAESAPGGAKHDISTTYKEPSSNRQENPCDPEVARLCQLMADLQNERLEDPGRFTPTDRWQTDMRRLHDLDGRSWDEIEGGIRWVHRNDFWSANILSPVKLRKHFDRLKLEAKRNGGRTDTDDRVQQHLERAEQLRREGR